MAHIREIKFRYVPKFSITKNIKFSNQKKIANNLVKYLKKLKYLKINNWVVKPASSGNTGKINPKERIKKKKKIYFLYVTFGSLNEAKSLEGKLVKNKLPTCTNIIPTLSHTSVR